ncbi:AraC family transcriptional regulator [Cupriavidus sp. 2MCAB6]|uniref:AraC family transcriptional regulator n=1 Tax=Cupriavidus sp. 2MCAB6 TaxID=3232981 RepID=UPI003F93373D
MDPLSDVLSLLRIQSYLSATLSAGGAWAIEFPAQEGIKFSAVGRGSCWLLVDGEPEPLQLREGDCFLLTRGKSFTLASDPTIQPIDSRAIVQRIAADELVWHCGGDDVVIFGGRFAFAGEPAALLIGTLPPLAHINEGSSQAMVLRWALERFTEELRDRQPGRSRMAEHLAHLMFVEILRVHLKATSQSGSGWLAALSDRNLSRVVGAMHAAPANRWSVEDFARVAGMSRSAFAYRFKQVVGVAPMEYLTRWRMLVAGDRLRHTDEHISSIAYSLGYDSESAFSTAFKRVMSCSPRQYQRSSTAQAVAQPAA